MTMYKSVIYLEDGTDLGLYLTNDPSYLIRELVGKFLCIETDLGTYAINVDKILYIETHACEEEDND